MSGFSASDARRSCRPDLLAFCDFGEEGVTGAWPFEVAGLAGTAFSLSRDSRDWPDLADREELCSDLGEDDLLPFGAPARVRGSLLGNRTRELGKIGDPETAEIGVSDGP